MYKEDFQSIKPGMIIVDTMGLGPMGESYRVIQRIDIARGSEKQILGVSKIWFLKCTFYNNRLEVSTDRSITYKHWKNAAHNYRIVPRWFFIKKVF